MVSEEGPEVAHGAVMHDEAWPVGARNARYDGHNVLMLAQLFHGLDLQQQISSFVRRGMFCDNKDEKIGNKIRSIK